MTIKGHLLSGEDRAHLTEVVLDPRLALQGGAALRVHGDLRSDSAQREAERARKLVKVRAHRAKRWVLELTTQAGPRFVKVSEPQSLGSRLQGTFRTVAHREHLAQLRAQQLQLNVSTTCGYLEHWRGARYVRSIQIQTPMMRLPSVETFLTARDNNVEAVQCVARALAYTHRLGFFHADLKGFHAFVDPGLPHLRWLDLGRVAFRLTARRRVINLYQALRFWLPPDRALQQTFVHAYGETLQLPAAARARLLERARRLLRYKLRTHPVVE